MIDCTLSKGKYEVAGNCVRPSAEVKLWTSGEEAEIGTVGRTVPGTFTASETFDVGFDKRSPVADDCFEKAPFDLEDEL